MDDIIIRVPVASADAFVGFWREVRSAEGFTSESDLGKPDEASRFDGATFAEWLVPMSQAVPAILTGILGYLVARRGEIEIGNKKFRNVTAKQIREVLSILDEYERRRKK